MTKICICGHKKTDHARWVDDNQCLICNSKPHLNSDGTSGCDIPFYDLVWLKFQSKTPMRNQS